MTLAVNRKRPGAGTLDLECPRPETAPEKYTDYRVEQGLLYASERLRSSTRKPSPTAEKLLPLYRGACKELLEERKKGENNWELLDEIREYEKDMSEKLVGQSGKVRGYISPAKSAAPAEALRTLRTIWRLHATSGASNPRWKQNEANTRLGKFVWDV